MNDVIDVTKEDCSRLDDRSLKNCFRALVLAYCEMNYPDEKNPLSSVSCGTVFDSKNAISCQIRLLDNNRLFFCRYIKETKKIMLQEYCMINIIEGDIYRDKDDRLLVGFLDTNDLFEEVCLKRKRKNMNTALSYEIERKPKKKMKCRFPKED